MQPPLPLEEHARLTALQQHEILDTPPEHEYDQITRLAAFICRTPMALVTFVDADRQWFKSRVGITVKETPRDISFCAYTILQPDMLVIPDTRADARFADNPLVTSDPFIRFYAGVPLISADGNALGSLCVLDQQPRELSPEQREALLTLAEQVMTHMHLRRSLAALQETITELQQAQSNAQESEERARHIVEYASDIIYRTDEHGRITYFNAATLRIMNCPSEAIQGCHYLELVQPAYRKRVERFYNRQFLRRIPNTYLEFPAASKTDPPLWLGQNVQFVSEQGKDLGFQAVARNITDRKRTEEQLKRSMQKVEWARLHAEEQARLLSAQALELARARDQALESTKAKSEFLANISHEIRTPMSAVFGLADLLLETPLVSHQRDFVLSIRESADDLLKIVNNLLDASKIEAGKVVVEKVPFDLRDTIRQVVGLMAPNAQTKGLRLEYRIPDDFPECLLGDPGLFRQILINLIGNAVKFTATGEVVLTALVLKQTDTMVTFRLQVADTGIGISQERQSAIFEPFTQAEGSTTRHYGGTGLGLTICRQLTELMGGHIGVESEQGHGSIFWAKWTLEKSAPINGQPDAEKTGNSSQGAQTPAEESPFSTLHVLLVEDNDVNRMLASHHLHSLGCHVDAYRNGREAVEALAQKVYDVVLMDVHMPEMDGLEATRRIRQLEAGTERHTPIVAVTATSASEEKERCLAAGMDDYLTKPFSIPDLRIVLARRLPLRHAIGESQATISPMTQPSLSTPTLIVLDSIQLRERCNGDERIVRAILKEFCRVAPQAMEDLEAAAVTDNGAELKLKAHSLKGSAWNIGGNRLGAACYNLEEAADSHDVGEIDAFVARVREEYKTLDIAIQDLLSRGA